MKQFLKKKKTLILALSLIIGVTATAWTIAVVTATTNSVTNQFEPASIDTYIEEKTDEEPVVVDTDILKMPVIVNNGPSNAFVRARITISPTTSTVLLKAGEWSAETGPDKKFDQTAIVFDKTFYNNGNWMYSEDDGFYYYKLPVEVKGETATLFDAVELSENADITIYQESVLAHSSYPLDKEVEIAKIKEIFDSVTKTTE